MFLDGSGAAETDAEIVGVAAQHAPDGTAFGAMGELGGGGDGRAFVVERGLAGEGNRVLALAQRPGELAGAGQNFRRIFGRPSGAGSVAEAAAEILDEVLVEGGGRGGCDGGEERGAGCGEGRSLFVLQFLVKALADDGPIAEVFGDGPDKIESVAAAAVDGGAGGFEERLGLRAGVAGKDDEELAGAAGAEQHARKAKLGDEGAGQHFHQQADPMGAARQERFGVGGAMRGIAGGRKKRGHAEEFALNENLNRHS